MNAYEQSIINALRKNGWKVLDRGWPDLLVWREGRCRGSVRVGAVEIKRGKDKLRPEQDAVHKVLRAIGLPVQVVREDFLANLRISKTSAVLTAEDKAKLQSDLNFAKCEMLRLQAIIDNLSGDIGQLGVIFEPTSINEITVGNEDVTDPTNHQIRLDATQKLVNYRDATK